MSQSNLWLQSSDPSPSHSIPVSGVSLGTKSHCKECMNATTAISVSHGSLVTPLSLRAGTDPHRFFIQHKTTQDRTAGVLPIPKTLLHAPAVPACCGAGSGANCPGRARVSLGGTSCSWLGPARALLPPAPVRGHRPSGTCHLFQLVPRACCSRSSWDTGSKYLGVSAKKISKENWR